MVCFSEWYKDCKRWWCA